jgi:hypothetical protein
LRRFIQGISAEFQECAQEFVESISCVAKEFDGWAPELTALITDGETAARTAIKVQRSYET